MAAVFTVLIVITFSLVVVRIASVALALTGLSESLARFQARSAFTGVGFTTVESEDVVNHPVRRRIIMLLMLFGQAGVVTAMASLVLTFITADAAAGWWATWWVRLLSLFNGILLILWLSHSRTVDRGMSRLFRWAIKHWKLLDVHDYAELFHLTNDYAISELKVQPEDWLANRKLSELRLSSEGVLVLGIERSNRHYLGAPRGDARLLPGDTLILYGREECLAELDRRRAGLAGNIEHMLAIDREMLIEEEQRNRDRQANLVGRESNHRMA